MISGAGGEMSSGGEYNDRVLLLGSNSSGSDGDLERGGGQSPTRSSSTSNKGGLASDLLKRLDRGLSGSGRRLSVKLRPDRDHYRLSALPSSPLSSDHGGSANAAGGDDYLGDSAPPEWALLLIGCLLGVATGLCVAAFNRGVHVIHEWTWAGTPNEGATWLRLQSLADTWHRILLIPLLGGVIVGVLHGLLEILGQINQATSQGQGLDVLAAIFPVLKAIQAAVTLGTGCSLGPEGPSVDIGKSCAQGFSVTMENNRERRIALVAAGAAAGIASGFNAAVAGCFFAIETVLRPLRAENSPPFTTAMIILASVISSTVSNAVLGEKQAFTVPTYDLKSAAELPLYLILGMLCGVVSVAFTRLLAWFTKAFQLIKERFGIPDVVCPALGGLGAGLIALKYPGILYWGFTNVDEILRTGKMPSAPGIWLLAQLSAAKVVATALCKGSGLVGGLYAPSLMIGAAVGALFGGCAGELINSAIPGNAAIAEPQAYALVGMAATLASVCSVPLTSVLLLFELTRDYRILLPLMGAVGLAIWVPSVTAQPKESEVSEAKSTPRGYSVVHPAEDKDEDTWKQTGERDDIELSIINNSSNHQPIDVDILLENIKVSQAMSYNYLKVSPTQTLREALNRMRDDQKSCALVVDAEDCLEGILTLGDVKRFLSKRSADGSSTDSADVKTCTVSSIFTRGISYRGRQRGLLFCYPDTDLGMAKQLMEAKGIKQLPVIKRAEDSLREQKRRIVAILYYDSIWTYLRDELNHRKTANQQQKEDNSGAITTNGHQ
ncbi:Cl- channel CLC-3 and related proteins (CLC superfamily) [Handroanthus impetiginosus]|uniref:Chloride channel protein n=1 Tax=Handroanthus impetiginosus TaxID=429701 RepID=A0A2G9H2V8_9LAMI|nr:Cl- channel CLC-3 and related proteins (CLC superfamily) [Handroanthus impetiginosus]